MKKLLIILALALLLPASAFAASNAYILGGGSAPAAASDACGSLTPTYDICYTGDYAADTDKMCLDNGNSSVDGACTGTCSFSTDYVAVSDANGYASWTTSEISESLGCIFFDLYIVDGGAAGIDDASLIEITDTTSMRINIFILGSTDKIYGKNVVTTRSADGDAGTVSAATSYRVGYKWETGADAGGKHAISLVAKGNATSWQEDVEDIDDGGGNPTKIEVGEHYSSFNSSDTARVSDIYVFGSYVCTDPNP